MAKRSWRVVLLAILVGAGCAGCLPTEKAAADSIANGAPTISGSPVTSAIAGKSWQFQPVATDPDGDALEFSATGLPAWASINRQTGLVAGMPEMADAGASWNIAIKVTDGKTSVSLPSFTLTVAATGGVATLRWSPPTQYMDGSMLPASELSAFRIYYGMNTGSLQRLAEVDSGTNAFIVQDLPPGTHYFAVTAVSSSGTESTFSQVGSKTIL